MINEIGGPSRRIALEIPEETLKEDLNHLKQKAIDLGASMAEIIPAEWVELDERVRLKCRVPMCSHYGKSAHCPPNSPDPDFMRRAFSRYRWAILFALDVIPVSEFSDRPVQQKAGIKWTRRIMEITGRLETAAFGNGYYLATGFSQFSCNAALCESKPCQVLQGNKCAHPLKARPSMEGVGIDAFRLVTKAGWEIYPIYRSVDPGAVPRAMSVGIVFVC
jgi:predicted metal-binding protein